MGYPVTIVPERDKYRLAGQVPLDMHMCRWDNIKVAAKGLELKYVTFAGEIIRRRYTPELERELAKELDNAYHWINEALKHRQTAAITIYTVIDGHVKSAENVLWSGVERTYVLIWGYRSVFTGDVRIETVWIPDFIVKEQ
jgi:hypothetical protein